MRSLATAALICAMATSAGGSDGRYGAPPRDLSLHLQRLRDAYPDVIERIDTSKLVLKSGAELPISDGRIDKTFEELLNQPDIDDMFALPYPAGANPAGPPIDADPGRVRVKALFDALYGDCRNGSLRESLRMVRWFGTTIMFTTRNSADKALEAVEAELAHLPKPLRKYLVPSAGTYSCRAIPGTRRPSMHAYAASIDLNIKFANYWRWSKPGKDGTYVWANRLPREIIEIFERHGFIWGGRWYHYDTMHFEYRPELLPR